MTDSEDRIFAAADKLFPSLEALNAWFAAQIHGTDNTAEKADLRFARETAIARHVQRAAAAANTPLATPPLAPKPPPEPLPPDASDDEQAARLYGPAPTKPKSNSAKARTEIAAPPPGPGTFRSMDALEKYYGRAIKAAGDDSAKVRELEIEREEAVAAFVSDDEAAQALYGGPIGMSFGAFHPKNPDNTEEADVNKANLPQSRRQQRALGRKFEELAKKDAPAQTEAKTATK